MPVFHACRGESTAKKLEWGAEVNETCKETAKSEQKLERSRPKTASSHEVSRAFMNFEQITRSTMNTLNIFDSIIDVYWKKWT
jgi:hypothetical protein